MQLKSGMLLPMLQKWNSPTQADPRGGLRQWNNLFVPHLLVEFANEAVSLEKVLGYSLFSVRSNLSDIVECLFYNME